jgi:hypothetical protein
MGPLSHCRKRRSLPGHQKTYIMISSKHSDKHKHLDITRPGSRHIQDSWNISGAASLGFRWVKLFPFRTLYYNIPSQKKHMFFTSEVISILNHCKELHIPSFTINTVFHVTMLSLQRIAYTLFYNLWFVSIRVLCRSFHFRVSLVVDYVPGITNIVILL